VGNRRRYGSGGRGARQGDGQSAMVCLSAKEAEKRGYLSVDILNRMHLAPTGSPVAYTQGEDGEKVYYYDAGHVAEAQLELWYRPAMEAQETRTLESGAVVVKLNTRQAAARGWYTRERLDRMGYDVAEGQEPVACSERAGGQLVCFYDRRAAVRRPLPCISCGKAERYKRKLCRACFEADLARRRAEGDAYRSKPYHMDRSRVLFFDLELTGVYTHDEIISVSVMNAMGEVLMDTLVRPLHKKKWTRTEKIHGITPAMVQDAPTLDELIPRIKQLFDGADNLIAFGVSTDYGHIKYIYETESEQEALHRKVRCAALEFVRYQNEHFPDNTHASLVDAMATLGITWEGIPHSSIADTVGCMKVWEALFPHYYDTPAPEAVSRGMTGVPYVLEGRTKLERAASMAATVGVSYGGFPADDEDGYGDSDSEGDSDSDSDGEDGDGEETAYV
jgi:DNA polymerase III epsilon subunit-like protein